MYDAFLANESRQSKPRRQTAHPLAYASGYLNAMPAFPNGPPSWPLPDEDVRAAILAAYASGAWGKYDGPSGAALQERLCETFHVDHAVLCSSGTIAVELALRGLKVNAGDEVILPGYDFPGNFRAIEAIGARPVLVDVLPNSWTIDPAQMKAAVSAQTKAVIVSHLHGDLADLQTIMPLANELGLKVLEDACQVPGAMIGDQPAGSFGDASVLSFGGSKLLTAGRGGAVLTSQADVAQRIRVFSFRGNEAFPLSELQAAVLIPQLARLESRTTIRAESIQRLRKLLQELDALVPAPGQNTNRSAYYKFAWRYLPAAAERETDCSHPTRDTIIRALQAEGIAIDAGFRGFNRRSANRCRIVGDLPNCESAATSTLLLHHPVLLQGAEQIDLLAAAIKRIVGGANPSLQSTGANQP
jgi:perosamine synthetase